MVRGRALRGDAREGIGLRVRPVDAEAGGGVGVDEGLGLHGGDLQDDRCWDVQQRYSGGGAGGLAAVRPVREERSRGEADPWGTVRPRSEDSGTDPSVEYDTSRPRESCGDFLRPVRDRALPGRGPRPPHRTAYSAAAPRSRSAWSYC
ncbi:hypothetical protein GCM10009549_43750 [Streptomyces thermoalcalitolerans]|uniref:Uncharacterized protein n=1 Tax=Streptomyces thermoalcalitolerans TaxID=65605 RepID=A0ABN1P6P4_9ACTN